MNKVIHRVATGLRALLCSLSALACSGIAATAHAAPQVTPPPSVEAVCNNVPGDGGGVLQSTPGVWWNPKRDGTGWQLVRLDNQDLVVTWYTYDQMGRPTWLTSLPKPVAADGTWQSELNRFTWVYGSGGGAGVRSAPTRVGSVAIRFHPADQTRAAIVWQWDLVGNTAQPPECIGDFSLVQARQEPNAVNAAFTGAWYEQALSGWGLTLNVVLSTSTGQTQYRETSALTVYDDTGNPVWLLGERPAPAGQPLEVPPPLNTPDSYPLSTYFAGPGYPNGVPTNDCDVQAGGCVLRLANAAEWRRSYSNPTNARAAFDLRATAAELQALVGPQRPLNGMSMTRFDRPFPTPPQPAPGQLGESVEIEKLSNATQVVVDRTRCEAAGAATSCAMVVNWSAHPMHYPNASLFQRNLATGAMAILQIGGQSGESLVTLPVNSTFRFELREDSNSFSRLVAESPVVTVTGNRLPTVTLDSPTQGGGPYTAPQSFSLAATASDADGTIDRVEFVVNGAIIFTDRDFPYQFAWTNVAAGNYSVSARAYDNLVGFSVTTPLSIVVATTPAAVLPTADVISDSVGATAAEFRVDESGAATYSVPIFGPPGTAGVAPQLTLNYSSQGPVGPLGRGWSIGGVSSIMRCRASQEAGDGDPLSPGTAIGANAPPVNFSVTDRFCLDGQRLLAVENSPVCASLDGTEAKQFRTEIDSYSRVCAYMLLSGPQSGSHRPRFFTVEGKDGSKRWFGERRTLNLAANEAYASGYLEGNSADTSDTLYHWAEVRSQDSSGNYIDYHYRKNPGLSAQVGELQLDSVHYTGKLQLTGQTASSSTPYASIKFNYEQDTALPTDAWFAGSTRWRTQRLKTIDSKVGGTALRQYRLTYLYSPTNNTESRLDSIRECRDETANAVCLPATQFRWSPATHDFSPILDPFQTIPTGSLVKFEGQKFGDIDGDGRMDMVWIKDGTGSSSDPSSGNNCGTELIYAALSRSASNGQPAFHAPYTALCAPAEFLSEGDDGNNDNSWFLFDHDGDGRDDIFLRGPTRWVGWRSLAGDANQSRPFEHIPQLDLLAYMPAPGVPAGTLAEEQPQLADLNGDGLTDLVYFNNGQARARLFERTGSNGSVGSFRWGAEQVVSWNASEVCSGIQDCGTPVLSGLYRKRNYQQINDFNGDAKSDLLMTFKIPGSCPAPPPPQPGPPGEGPPILPTAQGGSATNTPNACVIPWVLTMTVDRHVAAGSTKGGRASINVRPYPNGRWNNAYFEDVSFADINGDGLTDYVNHNTYYGYPSYAINRGNGFGPGALVASPGDPSPFLHNAKYMQVLDGNGDGRADIIYPGRQKNTLEIRRALPAGGFSQEQRFLGGREQVSPTGCGENAENCLITKSFIFSDLDADGALDYLLLDFDQTSNIKYRIAFASHRSQPRGVLEGITNGLGATTTVRYLPLTNRAVYRPDQGSRNAPLGGRGSPSIDLRAPMYVVSSASSSAPVQGNPEAKSTIYYRYAGAKLQAGGRGFLGFREIHSIDANHVNAYVVTQTSYRQDFPFIGSPATTTTRVHSSTFVDDACADVSSGLVADACFLRSAAMPPFAYSANPRLIARASNEYMSLTSLGLLPAQPMKVHLQKSQDARYDLNDGGVVSQVVTEFGDHGVVSGNVGFSRVCTYTSDLDIVCPVASTSSTALSTVSTANIYTDDAASWRLGRLTASTVTHHRPNLPPISRSTQFGYAMTGPKTGLLLMERIQPGGSADQDLVTWHVLDDYGNRLRSHTCTGGTLELTCKATTIPFNLADDSTGTYVRRYQGQQMDDRGRFMAGSFAPFWNGSAAIQLPTATVLQRNEFGDVTQARDLNNVETRAVFGTLGRAYYSWTQTTQGGVPGVAGQGVESRTTMRHCAPFANGVPCPNGARYRTETSATASPTQWTYSDVLGRPMLSVGQSFQHTVPGQAFSAVCRFHDALGREAAVSEPFFLPAIAGSGNAPSPLANTCGVSATVAYRLNVYDPLGRVVAQSNADTSAIFHDFTRLRTTIKDPLLKVRSELRNALGELVESQDALGLRVFYKYDATGNLTETRRNAVSNTGIPSPTDVVNTMTYDALGRKTSTVDPDAGSWFYRYNALGEQVKQVPMFETTQSRAIEQRYDARGRVFLKRVYGPAGALETTHNYTFDTAPQGQGQLAAETVTGKYYGWSSQPDLDVGFARNYRYDNLGRAHGSTTTIGTISYHTAVQYDAASRPWKVQDASGRSLKTEYTAIGHLLAQCDSEFGDASASCSVGPSTHLRVLATDGRGNVIRERRGDNTALEVSRTFDQKTGRLTDLCSGNAVDCSLQRDKYQWDVAGNLEWRDKAGQYREDFGYDDAHRLTTATYKRLVNEAVTLTHLRLDYDKLGNLCRKTSGTVAKDYRYGALAGCGQPGTPGVAGTGPKTHAADRVGGRKYGYDPLGNQDLSYDDGVQRFIRYTGEQQAYEVMLGVIETPTASSRFWYGSDGSRYKREDRSSGATTRLTLYLGNVEIITQGGSTVTKRYLGGVVQDIASSGTTNRYMFHDHLGSVVRIATSSGALESGTDFGPFGERRGYAHPQNGIIIAPQATTRGFTGHEMIEGMDVVHMNGRIYDSKIYRFLQPDPVIQEPNNPQNFNRYTYVWNNPLNASDPSGNIGIRERQALGTVIAIVGTVFAPAGAGVWYAAAVGATAGYVSTGTTQGALFGAFSAAVFFGIGEVFQGAQFGGCAKTFLNTGLSGAQFAGSVAAHGVAGGVMSRLQGGKFGHGFASAGATHALSPAIGKVGSRGGRVAVAAIAGGTVSALTGGKFANGALTAAFSRAFNDEAGGHGESDSAKEGNSAGEILTKMRDSVDSNPDVVVGLSLREFGILSDNVYKDAQALSYDDMGFAEFRMAAMTADSFWLSFADSVFTINGSLPPYSGRHLGSDINYMHQGMAWAAAGASRTEMSIAIMGWNSWQGLSGQGVRNFKQISHAQKWADFGYTYHVTASGK